MAHAVFRDLAAQHPSLIGEIDSAGTGAYHALDPPDPRTMSTLRRHGITDFDHAARKITKDDFRHFDYILAMDKYNLSDLQRVRDSVVGSKNPSAAARSAGMKTTRASAAGGGGGADGDKVAEVRLFGDFLPNGEVHQKVGGGEEVQDPYYGGQNGFEEVYGQVVRFSKGFLGYLEKKAES
ncbi:Low molecular weight phosphotyrosine protein phosphatase [Paecilomyces lecythidis]|uniref:Low molecular weight phosphotyrosine protein phosphatase n=1 Tax=Paecilomyces lecythidis TaxID=3004212 RepID=A0ABR3XSR2_9EURO